MNIEGLLEDYWDKKGLSKFVRREEEVIRGGNEVIIEGRCVWYSEGN